MLTTINGKNQVTLPAEIVRALGLTPGMRLAWRIGPDGRLVATPQPSRAQHAGALLGAGRKYVRLGSDPMRDLIAEREQDDDARLAAP